MNKLLTLLLFFAIGFCKLYAKPNGETAKTNNLCESYLNYNLVIDKSNSVLTNQKQAIACLESKLNNKNKPQIYLLITKDYEKTTSFYEKQEDSVNKNSFNSVKNILNKYIENAPISLHDSSIEFNLRATYFYILYIKYAQLQEDELTKALQNQHITSTEHIKQTYMLAIQHTVKALELLAKNQQLDSYIKGHYSVALYLYQVSLLENRAITRKEILLQALSISKNLENIMQGYSLSVLKSNILLELYKMKKIDASVHNSSVHLFANNKNLTLKSLYNEANKELLNTKKYLIKQDQNDAQIALVNKLLLELYIRHGEYKNVIKLVASAKNTPKLNQHTITTHAEGLLKQNEHLPYLGLTSPTSEDIRILSQLTLQNFKPKQAQKILSLINYQ